MARKSKLIEAACGTERRSTGYYSTPTFISDFIAKKMLEINPSGKRVLDPCIGREEMVGAFSSNKKTIEGIDVIDFGSHPQANFWEGNFLEMYMQWKDADVSSDDMPDFSSFDYWIANPPYNCHEVDYIKNNKSKLKKSFSDVGVHNMYSMFLSAMIDMATEGAVVGLIVFDSFLTSKAHSKLRQKIISQTTIHYLALCPTDLFRDQDADVRTCILIFEKGKREKVKIKSCNRPKRTQDLICLFKNENFVSSDLQEIVLAGDKDNLEFLLDVPEDVRGLFSSLPRVGDIFPCITGISTGNDKKYLSKNVAEGFSIPFYKNPGVRKFFTEPNAYLCNDFLDVSEKVSDFMVRNKKLLYKQGITCSSMGVEFSACFLPEKCTYGVNANIICEEQDIWWVLAYLNSKLATYIVRGVLNRSNMITSGYVSRIPVPLFDSESKMKMETLAKVAYEKAKLSQPIEGEMKAITKLVMEKAKISTSTQKYINDFCEDLLRMT